MKSFRQQKTIEGLDSLTDWKILKIRPIFPFRREAEAPATFY